jgi:hypothetical protein
VCLEMEFLGINLTKDSSLLLHAIHSPFYWRILKKKTLFSGFKNHYKKYAKQENSSLFMNCILNNGKMRVENLTKNVVQEFHLRVDIFMPEMEFLDINLTKDWSLLLHAIHNPFYWRILKKAIPYSTPFEIHTK